MGLEPGAGEPSPDNMVRLLDGDRLNRLELKPDSGLMDAIYCALYLSIILRCYAKPNWITRY